MTPVRRRVHEVLEQTLRGDRLSRLVNVGIIALIVANVVAVLLETVPEIDAAFGPWFRLFDHVSVGLFTFEFLLRLWSSAEGTREGETETAARLRYLRSPAALIDILAILPSYLALVLPIDLRVLRALRLLRLLKLTRYSSALALLYDVIQRERGPLLACIFILSVLIVVAATGIYLFEHRAQPEVFGSIPESAWWAVVTLTTVGYGDTYPITAMGRIFGAFITIIGVGMAALPAGILATGFADQLAQRRRQLEDLYYRAMADGHIDPDEERELDLLRRELGISRERAASIKARVREIRAGRNVCPHCGGLLSAHAPHHRAV